MIRRTFLTFCAAAAASTAASAFGLASRCFTFKSKTKDRSIKGRTWLEAIQQFDPYTQDMLLREAQRTAFWGDLPEELAFLGPGAFVDLGYDGLRLPKVQYKQLLRAFSHTGVLVPGTPYRLRHARCLRSLVEVPDGSERATLPSHWRQAVMVYRDH
jgi:hypothetical protein